MNLSEFIKKYNGKKVEAGGSSALYQCVDLVNAYIDEVLNLPKILWTNACDFPKKANKKYWFWISNTPMGVPKKGDIIVWNNKAGGGYGHVAIFVKGDVNKFTSFDQNWPLYSPAHLQGHYYKNVAGWLRPVKGGSMADVNALKDCLKDREKFWKERDEARKELKEKLRVISSQASELTKLKKEQKSLINKVEKLEEELKKVKELKEKWHSLYQQSQQNLKSCQLDRAMFEKKLTEMKKIKEPKRKVLRKLFYLMLEIDTMLDNLKQMA